jgi:PKD repeat protein
MKKIFFTTLLILSTFLVFSQGSSVKEAKQWFENRNEIYFSFSLENALDAEKLEYLSRIISIDKVENYTVTAYANPNSFSHFLELGLDFQILTPPSMLRQPRMLDGKEALNSDEWDYYPTYMGYIDIMNQFVTDYPDLCELVSIKTLASTREILFIHINNNLGSDEGEPEFMYTSSIHGDELTGYILTLRLTDYLLSNYGIDDQATNLVENIDIWINPLANPDGTYAGGNNTVFGATRGNANGIDCNRNFPDPEDGPHPDGNDWQQETQAFMDFAEEHDFVISANYHGGAEVCNYPWDTWAKLHADDDWWIYVARQYADTAHEYGPPGYLTDLNDGISNGYQWYTISGGRQDYMNYFQGCREQTLEISSQKTPPASQLEDFWEANYRSMLNYMEQSLYGVTGTVTNSSNGNPVPAEVFVVDHDKDNSEVYASMPSGVYHRPIKAGTYDFTFSSFGYYSKTISGIVVEDEETVVLNVELDPYVSLTADFYTNDSIIGIGSTIDFYDASSGNNIVSRDWFFEGGEPSTSTEEDPEGITYNEAGLFDVQLTVENQNGETNTELKENYIRVTEVFDMKDTTVWLCDGMFFDDGGINGYYSNDQETTITFVSLLESGKLKITFREFDIESSEGCEYDYLEAYDGMDENAPLLGRWCGTESPGILSANNVNGAITFKFHSNSTINQPGWKAEITCDTSVDIPEREHAAFKLFPNPAFNQVNITSQTLIRKISIHDLSGKTLLKKKGGDQKIEVDISKLPSGTYLIQLETSTEKFTERLLISRH